VSVWVQGGTGKGVGIVYGLPNPVNIIQWLGKLYFSYVIRNKDRGGDGHGQRGAEI